MTHQDAAHVVVELAAPGIVSDVVHEHVGAPSAVAICSGALNVAATLYGKKGARITPYGGKSARIIGRFEHTATITRKSVAVVFVSDGILRSVCDTARCVRAAATISVGDNSVALCRNAFKAANKFLVSIQDANKSRKDFSDVARFQNDTKFAIMFPTPTASIAAALTVAVDFESALDIPDQADTTTVQAVAITEIDTPEESMVDMIEEDTIKADTTADISTGNAAEGTGNTVEDTGNTDIGSAAEDIGSIDIGNAVEDIGSMAEDTGSIDIGNVEEDIGNAATTDTVVTGSAAEDTTNEAVSIADTIAKQ